MKYYLVDNGDNIIDKVELGSDVGINGAKTFFVGRKRIDEKEFDKLWKVTTMEEYDRKLRTALRNPSSCGQVEWWNDDNYLDIDK